MTNLTIIAKKIALGFAAVLVMFFSPGIAMADDPVSPPSDPSTTTTTTPDPATTPDPGTSGPSQTTATTPDPTTPTQPPQTGPTSPTGPTQPTGPQQPTGPSASTFHFNSATGMWENDYYTWNPVTHQTTPKNSPAYTYDPTTQKWDTQNWQYDPASGSYHQVIVPVSQGPNNNPGDSSTTQLNSTNNADVLNGLSSIALTGDAAITFNTLGGNATTGDAAILSNTANLLQSSLNLGGNNTGLPATFVADINGGVGDLMIDPGLLAMLQPASSCCSQNSNNTINVQNNGQIQNNISLDATTGDATIKGNTQAGNATTGDANAVANVMNLLNSAISANGSFLGIINIHGDLNGDILLPQDLMEKVLSSNAPTTTLDTSKITNGSLLANLTDNQNITNNVNTTAGSGSAMVANNTSAGSATTGNASTNVTLLNLTGHEVVGSNSLLVFVNVLGKWVGLIMDAPAGSTAAELGSSNSSLACPTCLGNTTLNSTNNGAITNNIDVNAQSGDATVADNTKAGNATSGNATASANILNLNNSTLSLTGWFGILFINVFGTWTGSFGVDTAAGDVPPPAPSEPVVASGTTSTGSGNVKVYSLTSTGDGNYQLGVVTNEEQTGDSSPATTASKNYAVLGSTTSNTGHRGSQVQFTAMGLLISCCLVLIDRRRAAAARQKKAGLSALAAQA